MSIIDAAAAAAAAAAATAAATATATATTDGDNNDVNRCKRRTVPHRATVRNGDFRDRF